jgi:predicted ABC-type transport system involved in lysophospholipase L1 biosynthesis ATPase subunit
MTHPSDTGHGRDRRPGAGTHFAAEFALLDGPTLEELSLYGDLADQADQIAELRAERTGLKTTVTGLRSELAEAERQRDALRQALAAVVDRVMQGDPDPLGEALDVLEQTGTGLLDLVDVPRALLAVAA